MTVEARRLRIASSMSLEQAMAEVRAYLQARDNASSAVPSEKQPNGTVRSSQFTMQAEMIARLTDIAGRLGHIGPDSNFGPPGVFLKRALGKSIGWYSRPAHEFNRAMVEYLHQIRQDMLLLQQQITALQQPATPNSSADSHSSVGGEDSEAILLMLELFKNEVAMKSFRQALRDENPELLLRYEAMLDKTERDTRDLRDALLKRMGGGT